MIMHMLTRTAAEKGLFMPTLGLVLRSRPVLATIAVLSGLAAGAVETSAEDLRSRKEERVYAFTHVNVVPMDRERVLTDRTVLIRNGRIISLGSARESGMPKDAVRIDGRGKYLMPGLADMHTHLFSDYEFPDSLAPDELALMLANGVTTVRFMIGTPEQLELRERVERGEVLGPTIYAASPQLSGKAYGKIFNGRVVATPEQARAAVREVAAAGYDFVKLTYAISRPVYDAVVETAREVRIPVIGHVDRQVGLQRALEARQQIEHLDGYMQAVLADDAPVEGSVDGIFVWKPDAWKSLDYIEDAKISEIARATAAAGVWVTPTLTFFKLAFGVGDTDEEVRSRPDWRFIPPKLRSEMLEGRRQFWVSPPLEKRRMRYVQVRNDLVRALRDAGAKLLAGSDTPEWLLLYGWTLHRELRTLVEAGLTPYEALQAATRNPAEWLGTLDESGTVEAGKRADLVLVEANPLEDIGNTTRIAGVMVRGRWLPKSELDAMLERIAPRFQTAFGETVGEAAGEATGQTAGPPAGEPAAEPAGESAGASE
jgi:imidazolonepropionase-like amidohydrolase